MYCKFASSPLPCRVWLFTALESAVSAFSFCLVPAQIIPAYLPQTNNADLFLKLKVVLIIIMMMNLFILPPSFFGFITQPVVSPSSV